MAKGLVQNGLDDLEGAKGRRPHPAIALAVCTSAAFVGAGGPGRAVASLVVLFACALLWRLPLVRLMRRVSVSLLAFLGFLVFVPFVGGHALDLVLRGFAVTCACLVLGSSVPWSVALATLEGLGLPRALVAYLAILARHAGTVRDEVVRMHRALALRGGYRTWRNRVRSFRILLVRLLPEVVQRADRTADVLALRGFRGRMPGRPCGPLGAVDAASAALGLVTLAVGVLL